MHRTVFASTSVDIRLKQLLAILFSGEKIISTHSIRFCLFFFSSMCKFQSVCVYVAHMLWSVNAQQSSPIHAVSDLRIRFICTLTACDAFELAHWFGDGLRLSDPLFISATAYRININELGIIFTLSTNHIRKYHR